MVMKSRQLPVKGKVVSEWFKEQKREQTLEEKQNGRRKQILICLVLWNEENVSNYWRNIQNGK
ncbi:hypothetical protein [Lentibacillus jeotgali]|uniref:hypothetical protein n=1 Tax=Lentibacillus jeotgali TaxID=558169 RepID=UPI00026287E8|nr:hypothetical protein [Lentibacillus jeotgali]